jgi:hypothetical protein
MTDRDSKAREIFHRYVPDHGISRRVLAILAFFVGVIVVGFPATYFWPDEYWTGLFSIAGGLVFTALYWRFIVPKLWR